MAVLRTGLIRAGLIWAGLACATTAAAADIQARFELDLAAGTSLTPARIVVRQESGALRELVLDATRLEAVAGDGQVVVKESRLHWVPPAGGGTLRYRVPLSHRRQGQNAAGHDAFVGKQYALFRGDDAFPVTSWRRAKGSTVEGELAVDRPRNWALITPYLPNTLGRLPIHNPGRRLPRPIGWITAGDLGTRRDTIAGIEITVTAPRGLRMERIAMLGLLRWTLPQLVPQLTPAHTPADGSRDGRRPGPRYINIVSAAEPMWLGALSAPNSLFVHADRPLISENGTSTVVHEMVHVLLADLDTPRDQDWIDEGLAEYLSLRALKDSGTISAQRYDGTIGAFRRWGEPVGSLRTTAASGPVTARAVVVFHDLDAELRKATGGKQTVAALVRDLLQADRPASLKSLRAAAGKVLGKPPRALAGTAVPGLD